MRVAVFFCATCLSALLFIGCSDGRVYDHYVNTPLSGWDKADRLSYDIPALKDSGWYAMDLGLRVNTAYPFLSLTLIVDQTAYPSQKSRIDTINCNLRDSDGKVRGQGIIFYQYHFQISALKLQQGDSLHVTVRHDMKRDILPGISDVGISLRRMMR